MVPAATQFVWGVLLAGQGVLLAVLLWRLMPGRHRRPPIAPRAAPRSDTTVSVVLTTLNEAERVGPCLEGLMHQQAPLLEVLVVDSNSTDGTRELVATAAARDARIRLLTDPPLPPGWVGKVWALEAGLREAQGEWVLGIDADTVPRPGLIGAVVDAADRDGYGVVSFSPQFVEQTSAERLVQPAMLTTLVYRCGAVGVRQPPPNRVLANGQCFLARRDVLLQHGGYAAVRESFSDDVTLARFLAARGIHVGFLDGSALIAVRAYTSLGQMWREWGRSFDLKDATPVWQRWLDVLLVWAVQGAPFPLLVVLGVHAWRGAELSMMFWIAIGINGGAFALRLYMLWALRGSYDTRGLPYWSSWLADIAAAARLTWSTLRTPRIWRGRVFIPSTLSS
ncbi:MAG: glycosyltransferase [Gemmatimonadaceae bacterium]|nr:glycosyltransferase [Gemmatimonadaceae bacterium]